MKTLIGYTVNASRSIVGTFRTGESAERIFEIMKKRGISPLDMQALHNFVRSNATKLTLGNHELVKNGSSITLFKLEARPALLHVKKLDVMLEGISGSKNGFCRSIENEINGLPEAVKGAAGKREKLKKAIEIMEFAYDRAIGELGKEGACEFFCQLITTAGNARNGFALKAIMGALANKLVEHEEFETLERLLASRKIQPEMRQTLALAEHVSLFYLFSDKFAEAAGALLGVFYKKQAGAAPIFSEPAGKGDAITDGHYLSNGKYAVFPSREIGAGTANELRRMFAEVFDAAKSEGVSLGRTEELTNVWLGSLPKE